MSEDPNELLEQIVEEEEVEFQEFTTDFFDRLSNKTTKLISNTNSDNFQKGRKKHFPFYFKEPTFVQRIVVTLEGYSSSTRVRFTWKSIASASKDNQEQLIEGNTVSITLNEVVTEFGFVPPRKNFGNPLITKVEVTGLTMGNFSDVIDKIGRINALQAQIINKCETSIAAVEEKEANIDELETSQQSIKDDIEEKKTEVEVLNSQIAGLSQQKAEVDASIEEVRSKETTLSVKIQSLEDTIDQKANESSGLNSAIEKKKSELKKLEDDINQFPAEFSGFLEQGGKNIKTYAGFTLVPLALILGLTTFLFVGAADLSAKYEVMEEMDLYTMLASRLPFTLIAGTIIYASYRLAKFLIEEIMKITRQRLNLTRISIIAKEVSQTSMVGLDLTDKEKAEVLNKLKMDILKSHLKSIVEADYENKIELSAWETFRSRGKIPKVKAKVDAGEKTATVEIDNAVSSG